MARIESKVRDLVDGDAGMRDAVETVLGAADDGRVDWVDVREDITSGHWGRLIEKGVLVDDEDGFRLADPEATRAALADGVETDAVDVDDEDVEESKWSIYDKGAALVTVALFAGYSIKWVRDIIGGAMDVVLGPLGDLLPFYAVVMVLAVVTGLYSTILQANLMNTEKMAQYQEQMQAIQDKRKEAKEAGDEEALERIQQEQMDAMGDQLGMFKEQFRPMVWIMFLTIPVFLWMYWGIGIGGNAQPIFDLQQLVLPIVGPKDWTDGVVGPIQAWIVWYFLCSMAFTQILRKGLNINISPTG
jgi:uncharacterized membrane protein (DUF106 family)